MTSNLEKEGVNTEQVRPRWFIDLPRYQESKRSFFALAHSRLCPKCQERLKGEISDADLIANFKDCCSKSRRFVSVGLPILESIFRLFLANGNEPLDLEELSKQLRERRGDATPRTSVETLACLLKNEQFYSIRQFQG